MTTSFWFSDLGHKICKHILQLSGEPCDNEYDQAALEVIDDEFKNNRVVNPTKEEIARMVFLKDAGDAARLYDEAWTIVKTR